MVATYKQNGPWQITESTRKLQTNRQDKQGETSRRVIPKWGNKGPKPILAR